MELPDALTILHQPVRLRIMTLLYRQGDVGFAVARKALDITPGNLDAHSKRLAEEGLLDSRRVLIGDRFEVRLFITLTGTRRYAAYLDVLETFLASARGD